MIKRIFFNILSKILPTKIAHAHCDIPCGIYDSHAAQVAAHTVIRMIQLLQGVNFNDKLKAQHDIARITKVKEDHAEMIEKELGTLENDYFKQEHFEEFPQLKELLSEAVRLSSQVRQKIDMEVAQKLLEEVLKISEIFYKSKGLKPIRVKSPYPTGSEIVVYK